MDKSFEGIANDPNIGRTQCEVWTRVMGYFRPKSAFNDGKRSEMKERVNYIFDGTG